MLHSNLSVNEQHHLAFCGVDAVSLAEKYGTPLMLLDEQRIRDRMRLYRDVMAREMGEGSFPCFASKALSFRHIYRIAAEEGIGIDVVSSGELLTAKSVGFPLARAMFHGNNKTEADIELGLDSKIGYFVVDSFDELNALEEACCRRGIRQKILLRLSPGIDPHTNAKVATGLVDCKFGFAIETAQAIEATEKALSLPHLSLSGFHCHVGSQCFDSSAFLDAVDIMLGFIAKVKQDYGYSAEILNLGGGYGVRYTEEDPHLDIAENLTQVARRIKQICAELTIQQPTIVMEPGRSIVADAGLTLYTCGCLKHITGYKSYVGVDGGMSDNPRYALYGSRYTALNASCADAEPNLTATLAGRCCESGDLIQENIKIASPKRGDVIAVLVTGAYNYSMASHYNRLPKPPVVMIRDGVDRLVIKRETIEDLMRNEL